MNEPMITGCQPDSGKPTVRDERGACGNVAVKGAGLRASGKRLELPPDPTDGARVVFLPDYNMFRRRSTAPGHIPMLLSTGVGSEMQRPRAIASANPILNLQKL